MSGAVIVVLWKGGSLAPRDGLVISPDAAPGAQVLLLQYSAKGPPGSQLQLCFDRTISFPVVFQFEVSVGWDF